MTLYRYYTLVAYIPDVLEKRVFVLTGEKMEDMLFEKALKNYPRADVYRITEHCVYCDNTSRESLVDYVHVLAEDVDVELYFESGKSISMCKASAIARYGIRGLRWIDKNRIGVMGNAIDTDETS